MTESLKFHSAEAVDDANAMLAAVKKQCDEYKAHLKALVDGISVAGVRKEVDGTVSVYYSYPDGFMEILRDIEKAQTSEAERG